MISRILAALLLCGLALPARANDSEAEIALGGLTLKKSDAISMDSEDLFISRDLVRVKYRFTNMSDAPVETIVAFPLPDIPAEDEGNIGYWSSPKDFQFKTRVDGRPIDFDIVEQAIFKGADVSARIAALKIPLNRFSQDFSDAVDRAPKAERDRLIAEGLLRNDGDEKTHNWSPLWSLRTNMTRRQTFPAKTSVSVEHQYVPRAGGSVGGGLDPQFRTGEDAKYFSQTRHKYCIDEDWLRSFDDRLKRARRKDGMIYSEIWLGYVLRTGANWNGPIKDFRLVIDKGKPDSLVSFCADGVKKISPTQFESRRVDYMPDGDLNILIVDWAR